MAPSQDSSKSTPVSARRRELVDVARKGWIKSLIDTTRRNNLLYFRDLKVGTLDLSGADPRAMERLLKVESVPLGKLLPKGVELATAEAKLEDIRKRAQMNAEERGIETLFVAMGMAQWDSHDGERPPEAAILLVPVTVEPRSRGGGGLALRRSGDIQVNLVLLHVLETEHGVSIAPEDLIAVLQGDDEGESFDQAPVHDVLKAAAMNVRGFTTSHRIVLGNFAFQKTAMVKDLHAAAELMAGHDLIAALSGDDEAVASVREKQVSEDPSELDRTPPAHEFLFLDADSSQQLVVRNVLKLQDGTIQGPPGTGKSQTIANLIAELSSRGLRVLFVAEKRAALDVVLERLRQKQLDHLALDLHGAAVSRKEIVARLQASLDRVGMVPPADAEKAHSRLVERRERLQAHVRRLHGACRPTGKTVYDVQGRLMRLGDSRLTRTRWEGTALDALTPDAFEKAAGALAELQEFRELFLRISPSPWDGAKLVDGAAVRRAMTLAKELEQDFPDWFQRATSALAKTKLRTLGSMVQAREQLSLIEATNRFFLSYRPELFREIDVDDLALTLGPAAYKGLKRTWQFITNGEYRRALRDAQSYRIEPKTRPEELLSGIRHACELRSRWQIEAGGRVSPVPVEEFAALQSRWHELESRIKELAAALVRQDLETSSPDELAELLNHLAQDRETPHRLPKLNELESQLQELGVGPLVLELRQHRPAPEEFLPWFEHAWLSSALDRAIESDQDLAGFQGRSHDRIVKEFRELDQERIELAAARVRRLHAEQAVSTMDSHQAEAGLVRRECQRKSRGLSVRKLLQEAPHVMTALRPCWMASPLSVSHLLPLGADLFDVVLFDEASQVLPQDAVPSLLRAKHAVVAGDSKQLPPTTFFLAEEEFDAESESEDNAATKGFESILDLMSGIFDPWSLDWHYRSKDEALIAFSNRHIYADRLVTFPGPGRQKSVEHYLVTQRFVDGQEDSVSDEVSKVVELVLQHAAARPDESLGVITLGIKHMMRVERAIEEARRDRPELDEFFSESKRERFFIKNLERVQGDERDAILLTVGYGKDRSGKLPYRFGPILGDGGERRLNVAVTRARSRMTVVSSFSHHDMDAKRSSAKGVEFLRLYLQYAASEGANLGDVQGPEVALNDFEQGIHDALVARGVKLLKQWGASRSSVTFVL